MPSASSVLTAAVAVGNVVFRRSQTWSMEKMGISGKSSNRRRLAGVILGACNKRRLSVLIKLANATMPRSAVSAARATPSRKKATQPSQSPSVRTAESRWSYSD